MHAHAGVTNARTQMNSTTRVLIIDDKPLTRRGISLLIEQQDDMKVVGELPRSADIPVPSPEFLSRPARPGRFEDGGFLPVHLGDLESAPVAGVVHPTVRDDGRHALAGIHAGPRRHEPDRVRIRKVGVAATRAEQSCRCWLISKLD